MVHHGPGGVRHGIRGVPRGCGTRKWNGARGRWLFDPRDGSLPGLDPGLEGLESRAHVQREAVYDGRAETRVAELRTAVLGEGDRGEEEGKVQELSQHNKSTARRPGARKK